MSMWKEGKVRLEVEDKTKLNQTEPQFANRSVYGDCVSRAEDLWASERLKKKC